VNFGLYQAFRNPARWARPFPDLYEEIIEQTVFSEQLGFGSAWLMEHHFVEDGYVPSLMPVLAALAMRTTNLRLGTFALNLNMQHPIRMAEDAAVVDILSGGRLEMRVAPGYAVHEYDGFGIKWEDRAALFEEQLQVMLNCWNEESFSFNGKFYSLQDVACTPKPVQRPHPKLYYGSWTRYSMKRFVKFFCQPGGLDGGLSAPAVAGPTGDMGWDAGVEAEHGFAVSPLGYSREELETEFARYEVDLGTVEDRIYGGSTALMWMHVCDDPDEGWEQIKDHALHLYNIYRPWTLQAGEREPFHADVWGEDPRAHFIVGPPELCIDRMESYLSRLSRLPDYFLLGMHMPGMAHETVMSSVQRFADGVLPHFATNSAAFTAAE
jgi:alkanesulfonate monooxygenase SsuD/methylene tetrahydromethanopterin reductase-like flavin-dependent oxidoreductase (luciferase family)